MRKSIGAIAALSIAAAVLTVASPAEEAQATISWPVTVPDTYGRSVLVNGTEDKITVSGCYFGHGIAVIDEGIANQQYPGGGNLYCESTSERSDYIADDGTVYATYANGSNPLLVAVKNGRIKWSIDYRNDLGLTDQCLSYAGAPFQPYSISTGADGNVYMVASHQYWRQGCASYLVGLDYSTGAALFTPIDLGIGGADGGRPAAWTYDDTIVAVDADGLLHEYDYDMVEDTGAQYQFPYTSLSGHPAEFMANEDGRIFMIADCGNKLYYYDRSTGNDGDMNQLTSCSGLTAAYSVGADGWLTAYVGASTVYRLDIPNNVTESLSVDTPSGYSNYYWQSWITSVYFDGDGNAVVVRYVKRNSPTSGNSVMVDYIEAGTNTQTNLATLDWDSTIYPGFPDYFDGALYVPVWFGSNNDTEVHKFDVAAEGLGDPGELRYGFSDPTGQLEYVAMGDSFSSGEGNPDFQFGTDEDGVNMCHRSPYAYPYLLAADPSLNLRLTDFVACSGATTDSLINGGASDGAWGESPQIDSLSEGTDIVTISIGGNNINFAGFIEACLDPSLSCDSTTDVYEQSEDLITDDLPDLLDNLFDEIKERIGPNTQVIVVGYPLIATDGLVGSLSNCWLVDSTERSAMVEIGNLLHYRLIAAVASTSDSRFGFVDPMESGSPFEDHDMCAEDNYINEYNLLGEREYTAHPNEDGHFAYYELIKEYMGNL